MRLPRVLLAALTACVSAPPAQSPRPVMLVPTNGAPAPAPPPLGAPPPQIGAPLAQGWSWPVNPQALAQGLTALTVYRPVNVAALRASTGTPCAPVEVAPSIWVTPFCGRMPRLSKSSFASAKPLVATSTGPSPSGVDLRALRLDGPIKDQQMAGVCWSFAISTIMDNALRRAGRSEVMAPLHIVADQEFDLLYQKGLGRPIVMESAWPYDPHKACKLDTSSGDRPFCAKAYGITSGTWQSDPTLVAERDRAEASGVYRVLTFHPLADTPGNPDELARVLGTGQSIFVGIDIDVALWSNVRHQADATIPDWPPDPSSGGHAVTLVGFRQGASGRQFLVHNSWGSGWGDGGYAWISERMIHDRMNQAFVVTVGDANGPLATAPSPVPIPAPITSLIPLPVPTPAPTPSPSPSGTAPSPTFRLPFPPPQACPQGSVRDGLFQQCVAACSNGAAPIAGICPIQAPAPAPSAGCPTGQRADLVTALCEPACPSGNPRAAGVCIF